MEREYTVLHNDNGSSDKLYVLIADGGVFNCYSCRNGARPLPQHTNIPVREFPRTVAEKIVKGYRIVDPANWTSTMMRSLMHILHPAELSSSIQPCTKIEGLEGPVSLSNLALLKG